MKAEAGREEPKKGGGVTSAPSFLCSTSLGVPFFFPDKEVTLGSSFYNWREGYRRMKRQDSSLVPESSSLSTLFLLLPAATGRTETYGTQSHQTDGEKSEKSGLWRPGWNLALASLRPQP